jgi:hypothetical protein
MSIATAPMKRPTRTTVKFEEAGRVWIRVSLDFGDGTSDSIQEDICSCDEAHTLFSEVEEEHFERMTRLLHRRNQSRLTAGAAGDPS